ncbi:hypothetical protein HRbin07_00686 [bacterium HR07]|nr:hypothetical protein HRbin07_00686 [bacterium HR07]
MIASHDAPNAIMRLVMTVVLSISMLPLMNGESNWVLVVKKILMSSSMSSAHASVAMSVAMGERWTWRTMP